MAVVHFLNVGDGDCNIIKHDSGHLSVIDVCNAMPSPVNNIAKALGLLSESPALATTNALAGNYNQKNNPTNPIEYMKGFGYKSIFRFILTHPDMDHMDGIRHVFSEFKPTNFWDTAHNKEMSKKELSESKYDEKDWEFYKTIRDSEDSPKTLNYYAGTELKYFNQDDNGPGGDGLYLLAPYKHLVTKQNQLKSNNYNDCSYVILFYCKGKKLIFSGDSHDNTWKEILDNHSKYRKYIEDVDVLFAPHHGRDSDRDFTFLDVLRPKLTLFGNASSNHLAYSEWTNRDLFKITNNQAGNVVLDITSSNLNVYVENENFAKGFSGYSYSPNFKAYHIGYV